MPTGFDTDVEAGRLIQDPDARVGSQNQVPPVPNPSLGDPVQVKTGKNSNHTRPRYHKDSLNRYTVLVQNEQSNQDHYLRPSDGKLDVVKVQIAPGFRSFEVTTGGKRTWTAIPFSSDGGIRDVPIGILKWAYKDYVESKTRDTEGLVLKYPIAAILLTFTSWLGNYNPKSNYAAQYPPVRYKFFGYAEFPRNKTEAIPGPPREKTIRGGGGRKEMEDDVLARHLRPRMLCVLTSYDDASGHFTYDVVDTDKWDRERPLKQSGEYIFVSYTRMHFQTYSPEEIASWDAPKDETDKKRREAMPGLYEGDLRQLEIIGAMAARKAGLQAFWIDIKCVGRAETAAAGLDAYDSHRICDVARGSNRVVIAVKELVEKRIFQMSDEPSTAEDLLCKWATRLWTLPEMLLAPTAHDLEVYYADRDGHGGTRPWKPISKRNMAEIAYRTYPGDGEQVRQLVDHFESSVQLTQIELLTLGLECLRAREVKSYSKADIVYALMTMARLRPVPDPKKNVFEAFAQLSLLNDSNMLLERLMCVLPPGKLGWDAIQDSWGVRLWDIFPTCQISDIAGNGADQTVLIDGAYGASIEWRHLKKVEFLKRRTMWRYIGEMAAQFAIVWLLIGIVTAAVFQGFPSMAAVYAVFFVLAGIAMSVLPHAMFSKYRGKFWSTQAVLYGMEGVPDIAWLERQLFGFSEGRLTWSPHGSTLSQHKVKEGRGEMLDGECEALAPLLGNENAPNPPGSVWGLSTLSDDGTRVFTLVDTYAMTVTAFRAKHPPTVALVLGHEGGMRRAALCSYNHWTQTFHRETIVRMPTKVLDRMDMVDKFRFSLKSLSDHVGDKEAKD